MKEKNGSMKTAALSQKLTESGLMIALGVILSVFKLSELPYGGSITLASMLPLIIIAYRYGFAWGSFTGIVYGLLQMLLGLKNVSYATSAVAAAAIILLDYIFAFSAVSLGAFFRKVKRLTAGFGFAALTVCLVRYIFHVISGCTVWAGLSIPTADALLYSLIYNATYMIPETLNTIIAAVYLASYIDFTSPRLKGAKADKASKSATILNAVSGLVVVGVLIAVVAIVFPNLQNAESGSFDITGIKNTNGYLLLIIVSAAAAVVIALQAIRIAEARKDKQTS